MTGEELIMIACPPLRYRRARSAAHQRDRTRRAPHVALIGDDKSSKSVKKSLKTKQKLPVEDLLWLSLDREKGLTVGNSGKRA